MTQLPFLPLGRVGLAALLAAEAVARGDGAGAQGVISQQGNRKCASSVLH
jgi:hypothetical protein